MTTNLRYRPQGSEGPYYNPADSIVAVFPQAVKVAIHAANNPENKKFLYTLGATDEGLQDAINFYEKYIDTLLNCEAKEEPFEAFSACDLPSGDISFLLFQSWVAGSLMASYHETLVDFKGEMREWREMYMTDLKDYITAARTKQSE